jgi:hypothetical protein
VSRFKSRVARLERGSADFGTPADLLTRMVAAPDGGAAIFGALSPARRRAYQDWNRSPVVDERILSLAAATRDGSR